MNPFLELLMVTTKQMRQSMDEVKRIVDTLKDKIAALNEDVEDILLVGSEAKKFKEDMAEVDLFKRRCIAFFKT